MKLRLLYLVGMSILIILAASVASAQSHTYVGVDKCKLCHKLQYDSWLKTKHAVAFNALKPDEQKKKECYQCHVTGDNVSLPGVQCEACHGPGSDYRAISVMKDKKKAIAAGLDIPTEKTCVKCHNKQSPTFKGFNFSEAIKTGIHAHKKG